MIFFFLKNKVNSKIMTKIFCDIADAKIKNFFKKIVKGFDNPSNEKSGAKIINLIQSI